jgi:2-phospho-L-lactate transferase/gluconeogenesis factor (CofD/UPF0052 family)
MTQPGETDGFSALKHLQVLREYAPQLNFDHVVLNSQKISGEQQAKYASEGASQIGLDELEAVAHAYGVNVVYTNLLSEGEMVRHDFDRLARAVLSCVVSAEAAA